MLEGEIMKLRLTLILFSDALLALFAQYSALTLCFGVSDLCEEWSKGQLVRTPLIFVATVLFSSYLMDVYTLDRRCKKWEIFIKSMQASVTSLLLLFVIFFLAPTATLGQNELAICVGFFFLYQFLWHAFSSLAVRSPHLCQRVLIMGTGRLARQLGEMIEKGDTQYTLAGYLDRPELREGDGEMIPEQLLVRREADLCATAAKVKAGVIVVAVAERRGVLPLQEMLQCKLEGMRVFDAPTFYETVQEKLLLEEITPGWIIFSAGFHRTRLFLFLKRCFDMLISFTGLVLAAPLFPIIGLAIKLDSPGPVFFKQVRVGSAEKLFTLYKFRSMRTDAERDGAKWAAENDSRVTRVGRLLRDYRIDEIPQLVNVLKGDMSFIGPRPERPEFVQTLKSQIYYYSKRHILKPGLTGWAQVRYPYGATVEDAVEKLRYDLYYIKNHSFLLDSQIIFETLKVVVFGVGGR
jgi:sugar transferase (PEP-CTERM system associated)